MRLCDVLSVRDPGAGEEPLQRGLLADHVQADNQTLVISLRRAFYDINTWPCSISQGLDLTLAT